jgi:plasmid stability protein
MIRLGKTRGPCDTDLVAIVTLTLDKEILKRARIRALEQGTSVNAVVREFLASYAGAGDRAENMRRFLEIAKDAESVRDGRGRNWRREDLYEDRTTWPRS